jgi:hypothetical protein
MDVARINAILADSLGEVDENQQPVEGSELFNFFVIVLALKTEKVRLHAHEMIELLKDWPSETWGAAVPPLGQEINYLTVGAVLGDQQRAFIFFAFGKIMNWWDIMDPHSMLGIEYDEPLGQKLAGMGMVAIMDYRPTIGV